MVIGRNQPCKCGRNRKYKHCCLKQKDAALGVENKQYSETANFFGSEDKSTLEDIGGALQHLMYNLHARGLEKHPHIKEYKKLRELHDEMAQHMVDYLDNKHFVFSFNSEAALADREARGCDPANTPAVNANLDTSTPEGAQAYYDIHIYKMTPYSNSITEEYLSQRRFRTPEKIALLEAMNSSICGLYEITDRDKNLGYVYLKNVFTNTEHKIIDIGLTATENRDLYIYRRIVTVNEISFSVGITLVFETSD